MQLGGRNVVLGGCRTGRRVRRTAEIVVFFADKRHVTFSGDTQQRQLPRGPNAFENPPDASRNAVALSECTSRPAGTCPSEHHKIMRLIPEFSRARAAGHRRPVLAKIVERTVILAHPKIEAARVLAEFAGERAADVGQIDRTGDLVLGMGWP